MCAIFLRNRENIQIAYRAFGCDLLEKLLFYYIMYNSLYVPTRNS